MNSIENARDRGKADSYYGRAMIPHIRVDGKDIPVARNSLEWAAYMDGYEVNEIIENFKDWGIA